MARNMAVMRILRWSSGTLNRIVYSLPTAISPDLVSDSVSGGGDDGLAPGGGELGGGRLAELGGVDDQRLAHLAIAEDLDPIIMPTLDPPSGAQGGLVEDRAGLVAGLERREVDDGVVFLEGAIEEAPLRHPAGERDLAPLEQGPLLEPLARRVPLVPLGRRLAVPRADPAADPLAFLALVDVAMDVVQLHYRA